MTVSPIARFLDRCTHEALPPDVLDAGRRCAVDWFAAGLAGVGDADSAPFTQLVHRMQSSGNAMVLDGRRAAAAPAALANAVLAHTADFDDFHLASIHHASAPTFAAVFALGMERRTSGADMLAAFIAGFEVGTHLGLGGTGMRLAQRGWHPTSILGHLSAAAACASLLRLSPDAAERALGHAAVQAGGLMAAAGTMAKALIVGKAAMGGVMAAQLAEAGALAPPGMVGGSERGLLATLFQDSTQPALDGLGDTWQVLQNTFKPYPACQLAHASFDAARSAGQRIRPERIRSVVAHVNPFALTIAKHWRPTTPLESRFSLNHCIALGLLGYEAAMGDFTDSRLNEPAVRALRERISGEADEKVERWSSRLEITLDDGSQVVEFVPAALGSLGRPMAWGDLESKFRTVAQPMFGQATETLFGAIRHFDAVGSIEAIARILSSRVPPSR